MLGKAMAGGSAKYKIKSVDDVRNAQDGDTE